MTSSYRGNDTLVSRSTVIPAHAGIQRPRIRECTSLTPGDRAKNAGLAKEQDKAFDEFTGFPRARE